MSDFFYIKIANGLLEPKHCIAMGEAVWLYMWLQDKTTSINENQLGKVLGNKPIVYEDDIKPALGISRQVYIRWIDRLRSAGYIQTIRTPRGLVIVTTKAKKFTTKRSTEIEHPIVSDVLKSNSDVLKITTDVLNPDMQYKTKQRLNKTKTNTNVEVQKNIRLVWDFYLDKFNKNPNSSTLTQARREKIRSRLKDAGLDMLKNAIINTSNSPFHTGDNDRGWKANIDFIIRSYEQVERLANLDESGPDAPARTISSDDLTRLLGGNHGL